MNYWSSTQQRLRNAKAVVQQLRNGEWGFDYNSICGHSCRAYRNGRSMWVGNGALFLDVDDENAFGLVFRHYVWWAAARKARKESDRSHLVQKKVIDLTL